MIEGAHVAAVGIVVAADTRLLEPVKAHNCPTVEGSFDPRPGEAGHPDSEPDMDFAADIAAGVPAAEAEPTDWDRQHILTEAAWRCTDRNAYRYEE